MTDHSLELFAIADPQDSTGYGDGSVTRVAAGGKGIGGVGFDEVEPRHWNSASNRKFSYDVGELWVVGFADGLRAVGREDHLVREPVAEEIHHGGEDEGDNYSALSADRAADKHNQAGQKTEK